MEHVPTYEYMDATLRQCNRRPQLVYAMGLIINLVINYIIIINLVNVIKWWWSNPKTGAGFLSSTAALFCKDLLCFGKDDLVLRPARGAKGAKKAKISIQNHSFFSDVSPIHVRKQSHRWYQAGFKYWFPGVGFRWFRAKSITLSSGTICWKKKSFSILWGSSLEFTTGCHHSILHLRKWKLWTARFQVSAIRNIFFQVFCCCLPYVFTDIIHTYIYMCKYIYCTPDN